MLSLFQRNSVISLNKSAISFIGIYTSRTAVSLMSDYFYFLFLSLLRLLLFLCLFCLHSPWLYLAFSSVILFFAIYLFFLGICNACVCPIMIVNWYPPFIFLALHSSFCLTGIFFIPYPYSSFCFIEYMFLLSSIAWISFEDFRDFLLYF